MSLVKLCEHVGMSRQNYYKTHQGRKRKQVDEQIIRDLVQEERCLQPRLGGRKLYEILKQELEDQGIEIGRDRFFEVLGNQELLVEPLPRQPHTTMSRHSLPTFPNRVKDLKESKPNQVWVSDITYIRLEDGYAYLSLITDRYSRKVVGWHVGEDLKAESSLRALEKALESLKEGEQPIHHSDRGCQYCSHAYVNRLQEAGLEVSMTEENHCAENALAERVNGILKQEYGLRGVYQTVEEVRKSVDQAIWLYNTRRPHESLGMKTPAIIHQKKVA